MDSRFRRIVKRRQLTAKQWSALLFAVAGIAAALTSISMKIWPAP